MNKDVAMSEVFTHDEDYYTKEYQNSWRNDLELLERITNDCSVNDVERLYDMIDSGVYELMDLVAYIIRNKKS